MADDDDHIDDKERALLLNFLTERDVYCPLCQYNLRNSTVTNCPECGKAIRLTVVTPNLALHAWGLLMFVLTLPAGIGIIFLTILTDSLFSASRSVSTRSLA